MSPWQTPACLEGEIEMKKSIGTDFLLCGLCGWCMECFWTGLSSILHHKDRELSCRTSVWMFPIYGMAALLGPIGRRLNGLPAVIRGGIYTCMIYFAEYTTGSLLKKHHACPWDYSKSRFHYKGLIRFDYAPAWFLVGLFYERLLLVRR